MVCLNGPTRVDIGGISATGAEVGRDVIRLRKILDGFTKFSHSPIFAPDFPGSLSTKEAQFIRDLLIQAGPVLGAIFIQPQFKPEEDPGQTIMNAVVNLDNNVWSKALRLGRIIPRKPIWIAEKEISKGTSEEALTLTRRLGVAAKIGVQIVMRQLGPDSLKRPTPEFWMALLYKNLVGRGVLDARVMSSQNQTELYIFSHCTHALPPHKSIIDAGMIYDKGAVTVYGVNEGSEDIKISLKVGMREEKIHVYSLTFAEDPDRRTEETYLNGQLLSLSPAGDLPIVSPRIVRRPSKTGIIIPSRSVFFFVLPDVKSRTCSATPSLPSEVQELSRKLIQVVGEVLDKPNSRPQQEEVEETGKLYVRFNKQPNLMLNTLKEENKPEIIVADSPKLEQLTSTEMSTAAYSEVIKGPMEPENAIPEQQNRRKRSVGTKSPNLDMEITGTNQLLVPSQEDLVNHFNSYARKVYESSRESGTGGDVQLYSVPEEILNTLKRVKVTFKPLGVTRAPLIPISEGPTSTIEPTTESDNESNDSQTENKGNIADVEAENNDESAGELNDAENSSDSTLNEESVLNEMEDSSSPDLKRFEKQAEFNENELNEEDSKGEKEGETIFRESNENAHEPGEDGKSQPGEDLQESDTGTEAESPIKSPSGPQDQPEEEVSRDEPVRESESPTETTGDGGDGGEEEEDRDTDVGGEARLADESSVGERTDGEAEGTPTAADSLSSLSPTFPSKFTSQDDKEAAEVLDSNKNGKKEDDTKVHYLEQMPPTSPKEIGNEEEINNLKLTTTEMPEVIAIDGIEPKKVDELLMNIAGNNVVEDNEENKINGEPKKHLESNLIMPRVNTEKEERKQKKEFTETDIHEKSPKEDFEIVEDIEETDKSDQVLKSGPEIPLANPEETVKLARGIISSDSKGKPVMILLHPTMKTDDPSSSKLGELVEGKNVENPEENETEFVKSSGTDVEADDQSEDLIEDPVVDESPAEPLKSASQGDADSPLIQEKEEEIEDSESQSLQDEKSKSNVESNPSVVLPLAAAYVPDSSSSLPGSVTEAVDNDDGSAGKAKELSGGKGVKAVSEVAKRLEVLRAEAEQERKEKLIAIRNQILEAKQKFLALTRDNNWRSALQQREEELRKKLAPSARAPPEILSRPRRLSYYPEDGLSEEEIYSYGSDKYYPKRSDSYGNPVNDYYGKSYLSHDALSNALNQDNRHIIFPLDPKTPQAVVYNNKIIPAKLYGVIGLDEGSSKVSSSKPIEEEPPYSDPFFTKYYNSASKFSSPSLSSPPALKSTETYTVPKDAYIRRSDDSHNFLPVVVLSPHGNILRRKRSAPDLPYNKYLDKKRLAAIHHHTLKKRSISSLETGSGKVSKTDIPKEVVKDIISNEIRPSDYKVSKSYGDYQPVNSGYGMVDTFDYGGIGPSWNSIEFGKPSEGRTFNLPPLPPPLPLFDPPRGYPPSEQFLQPSRELPPEPPLPPPHPFPDFPDHPPLFPPPTASSSPTLPEKREPEPSQAYFFTILQDKFKSLMGMLETLAVWCGASK